MKITRLDQLDMNKLYSYADYYSWKIRERVELFKGKIVAMSPTPSTEHQRLSGKIYSKLYNFLEGQICQVFSAPFDVRLVRHKNEKKIKTVVQPDICVICDISKLDVKGCNGAPELIIEILSTGNSSKEMKIKYDLYESSGVLEYWIVDPEHHFIHQYIAASGKFVQQRPLVEGDMIRSKAVKGFKLKVNEIFN